MTDSETLALLDELRQRYPSLEIWCNAMPYGGGWVWFARGRNGRPWLIMSADHDRFRRWLAAEAN